MKVLSVVGARPQFVKAAMVSRALRQRGGHEVLLHTGQHYDYNMSSRFFEELDIPKPNYQLAVGSANHGAQTGGMLIRIEEVLLREHPDWVLVYGDTNSTLAGALAAAKLHIPVAHVEAGLRSFNRRMPEEINRVLTDHTATKLYVPTPAAVQHLANEGINGASVELVGDVMYDAALHYAGKGSGTAALLRSLGLSKNSFVLATLHRAENTESAAKLRPILEGLALTALHLPVVLPLHPRTRQAIAAFGLEAPLGQPGLHILDPLGYLDMTGLEQNAAVIATDSGGVQKEAYFHRVPCVTLRTETEWVELVDTGWNRLGPLTDAAAVAASILAARNSTGRAVELYGNGRAATAIAASLLATTDHPSRTAA